jgi:hypothetical protein
MPSTLEAKVLRLPRGAFAAPLPDKDAGLDFCSGGGLLAGERVERDPLAGD